MSRWTLKTQAYDYDDELMVKGGLIKAGIDYINKLKNEEEILLNSLQEIDETKDSFMMTQYKIEINNITNDHLNNNKMMSDFIQDKELEILSLFETILEDDDSSSRLAEFYLYQATLERSTEKLIRLISYTPTIKKGYINLYQSIYHEIKRMIEWYYADDKSEVVKWKFYTNPNYTGIHVNFIKIKYNFIPIDTTNKPIRKAASLITYLLTNKKPNIKNNISHDNLHFIL